MNSSKLKFKRFLFRSKLYKLNSLFNRFYIIPYHMVVDKPNGFYPEISIHDFEKQVAHLSKNYNVISLDEIVERVMRRESLKGCVAITFDDGFRDNYEKAYPILKQYGVPATIFLTTGYVGVERVPWFIELRRIFMETKKTEFHYRHSDVSFSMLMRSQQERYLASGKVMDYLKGFEEARERNDLLDSLGEQLGVKGRVRTRRLMLNWEEIKEMAENGISFGAHTVSHPVLARIALEKAEREIVDSKRAIEEEVGRKVNAFSYPFGKKDHFGEEIIKILRRYDFKGAVTGENGTNNPKTNVFEINRCFPWEMREHKW